MAEPKLARDHHFQRWGAVYILIVLWLGSWGLQALTMRPEIREKGWIEFWAATMENWQSEWLQLIFQSLLLLAGKHWLFRADAEDLERVEAKIDNLDALIRRPPSSH